MVWDYTKTEYEKQANADPAWHLERLIKYGLEGYKLNEKMLKKYLPQLRIPENQRAALEFLVWGKKF